jgi:hypothetical protein
MPALYYLVCAARWLKWSRRPRHVDAVHYARQSVVRRQRRRVMLAAKATGGRGCFSSAHSPVWVGGVQGLVAARSKCGCGSKATNDEWHHQPGG